MLRLALPILSCAALLWCHAEAPTTPRSGSAAPAAVPAALLSNVVREISDERVPVGAEVDPAPVRSASEPEAPSDVPEPPEPAELRQHDVRDLVARGLDVEQLARMAGREGATVTPIVNVLEVVAPAGRQIEIELLLDERRRSVPKRVLQFYDVKDLCAAPPAPADDGVEPASPFEIESLVEVIEATVGIGAAEIRPKNDVLVVRAEPVVQAEIARFLADLRSDGEGELRQHDVRDLVARGLDIADVALRVEHEASAEPGSVIARMNVLEIRASEATQLAVERILEEQRRIGTRKLRIHPVADLLTKQQHEEHGNALAVLDDVTEPLFGPFELHPLVDLVRQVTGADVGTTRPRGMNLVVLAEPATHARIADLLDEFRSNVHEDLAAPEGS